MYLYFEKVYFDEIFLILNINYANYLNERGGMIGQFRFAVICQQFLS